MDLQEFIEQTLISIHDGVDKAKGIIEGRDGSGAVNPVHLENTKTTSIEFDVAITVNESQQTDKSGGARLQVLSTSFGGGLSKQEHILNQSVSRIKFSVSLRLPHSKDSEQQTADARQAQSIAQLTASCSQAGRKW